MNNKFFITTPIYYVNDVPHIGHAYATVAADVLARHWKRKIGSNNVFFLAGTDEHGIKVAQSAKVHGQTPKEYADVVSPRFQGVWHSLNIKYDYFLRTTNPKHEKIVQETLQKIYGKGFIYEDIYEGLYCEGCERFLTEDDLIDGKCPFHSNKEPVYQKEKNYFFKLSSFEQRLKKLFESDKVEILPIERKNEVLGKLARGLQNISISRAAVSWGIPVPWDEEQTIYVWFDALLNYYTATQFLRDKKKFWPADLHLVGKDILWFHTIIWCALLLAADLPLPKKVFAHGFFTVNGQKMSKSIGNVIAPQDLISKFGPDATRYLLLSQFPFGHDGDFSFEKLIDRYNADLANNLGNLIARVEKLAEGYSFQKIKRPKPALVESENLIENLKFEEAILHTRTLVQNLNKYIDEKEPWNKKTRERNKILSDIIIGTESLTSLLEIAEIIEPILPETSQKIKERFENHKIKPGQPLFPRIS